MYGLLKFQESVVMPMTEEKRPQASKLSVSTLSFSPVVYMDKKRPYWQQAGKVLMSARDIYLYQG